MFRFFFQYYLFLKWRHLFNDCPQPAFKGNKPILGFPGLVIERSITNQCGHVDVSNPVQQQPLKASLTCGPEDTFLGNHLKSSAVRVSRAPAGMTSKRPSLNFFKAFSWLLTCNFVSDCQYCWPQNAFTEENLPFGDAHTCARTGRCSRLWPPHLGHLGWVLHSLPLPQCRGQWRRSSPVPAQKDVHNHGMFLNLWHLQGCSIVTARFFSINNQLSQGFVDHRVKEGQVMELYGPGKQHAVQMKDWYTKNSKYLLRMYLMTCLLRKRGQSSFWRRQSPMRRPTFLNAFSLTSVGRAWVRENYMKCATTVWVTQVIYRRRSIFTCRGL